MFDTPTLGYVQMIRRYPGVGIENIQASLYPLNTFYLIDNRKRIRMPDSIISYTRLLGSYKFCLVGETAPVKSIGLMLIYGGLMKGQRLKPVVYREIYKCITLV